MSKFVLGDTTVVTREGIPRREDPDRIVVQLRQTRSVAPERAHAHAGFRVWQPGYLPSAALALRDVLLISADVAGTTRVVDVLTKYKEGPFRWLAIEQSPILGGETATLGLPFELTEDRVGDLPAVFYSFPVDTSDAPGGSITIRRCVWERGGFLMSLEPPARISRRRRCRA